MAAETEAGSRLAVGRAPTPRAAARSGAGLGLRTYLTGSGVWPLAVALSVVAVLLPVALTEFAVADDAAMLWMAVSGESTAQFGDSVIAQNAVGGRPLAGLLVQVVFHVAGTIDHLRYVRALSVASVALFALLLHWNLMRAGLDRVVAVLIAVLVCSMPGFLVFASWGVLIAAPLAAIAAGVASMVTVRGVDRGIGLRSWEYPTAAGLVLAGTWLYQPPAMFYWVFLAIAIVGALDDPVRAWRLAWTHLLVGAVGLAVSFASVKAFVWYFGSDTPGATRSGLSHDVPGRLRWFGEEPLYHALNLFDLTPTQWEAAIVVAVAAAGMLLWLFTSVRRPWLYAGIAIALVPLSHLPNLVVTDPWSPLRTQTALAGLLALYLSLGAIGLWLVADRATGLRLNEDERRLWRILPRGVAVAVVAVSCVVGTSNVSNLNARPLNTELRMLRGQVRGLAPETPRLTFVFTDWYGGMTDFVAYDELGLPFGARPWAPGPMIDLLLDEEGRLTSGYRGPDIDYYMSGSTRFPPGQPVIDLRGIRALR
ncbi:MAG TPA: hypothetical protein PLX85_08150 [Dehalococcoidia bacterium]|nr:hypothetical protein [Dehalococcoidia bacterium]